METARATHTTHPNAFKWLPDPKSEGVRSSALWYAWGALDAGANLPTEPEHFAALYAEHAARWQTGGLRLSVQSAFSRWLAREPIDLVGKALDAVYERNAKR